MALRLASLKTNKQFISLKPLFESVFCKVLFTLHVRTDRVQFSHGQCYFSCDFLVIVIVKVIIFQVFQLQF